MEGVTAEERQTDERERGQEIGRGVQRVDGDREKERRRVQERVKRVQV